MQNSLIKPIGPTGENVEHWIFTKSTFNSTFIYNSGEFYWASISLYRVSKHSLITVYKDLPSWIYSIASK